ncbi:hypothetical protein FPCIR_3673 [Fusarium pseudocircinatum]|uniref:Uncharacterized protein n=1 Tax=Fusarium pseudocircinatum TaxID=56676 RepID=A0A8H5PJ39_9HYPO|nr:hypothetical protein FPCIR_3673 [Fusarium pseudocircinatum]
MFGNSARKYRLYIALYARDGKCTKTKHEDRYHWAFMVGPKKETKNSWGKRFHVKRVLRSIGNPPSIESFWSFEEVDVSIGLESMILTRVLIGKVKDLDRLRLALQRTPFHPELKCWNWVDWIEEAHREVIHDAGALGTCVADWEAIRDTAMLYVESKKLAHRFDGGIAHSLTNVPTWDMLRRVETTP